MVVSCSCWISFGLLLLHVPNRKRKQRHRLSLDPAKIAGGVGHFNPSRATRVGFLILYNNLILNNNFPILNTGTVIALLYFESFVQKIERASSMVSSSIPSPIAHEPILPRRQPARSKAMPGFAQSLAEASANAPMKSHEAKVAKALSEPVQPPKRAEKAPRSRDDNKADAAKPTASAAKTNPKSESDAKTPRDIDKYINAQRDEPDADTSTIPIAHEADAGKETPRLKKQPTFIDEQNSEETEANPPAAINAAQIPQQGSTTAQEFLQTQITQAIDTRTIDETTTKRMVATETTLSPVALNRDEDGSPTNIDSFDGLKDADLNADPVILDNKDLQPKSSKADMINKSNSNLLTLISNSNQQNNYDEISTDISVGTGPHTANSSITTALLQRAPTISPSVMTSNRDGASQIFGNNNKETTIETSALASADSTLDQNISTEAAPFVPAHLSTPLLTVHTAPIMTSGRIVYPSLPYSRVPMEIGLSALEGQRSIQVRLSPVDLGTIEIELDVSDQSEARAHISADDPRTLAMLKLDAPFIRQALEQTGLSTHADSLNFSLRQDGQSGARQNPNEQRTSSSPSAKTSDKSIPTNTPLHPTPMKRVNSLLDVNI